MEMKFEEAVVGEMNDSLEKIRTALDDLRFGDNVSAIANIAGEEHKIRELLATGVLDGK